MTRPKASRPVRPPLPTGLNVQFGAGYTAAEGWLNYDSSPTIRLERLPLIGRLLNINRERFPKEILLGDIVTGLPVPPGAAKAVYASHVLEHLSYQDCLRALANTFTMLAPGGAFRLVVPDLAGRVDRYLEMRRRGVADAANDLCRSTMLGQIERPRGPVGLIRAALGNSRHLWMWDEPSLTAALRDAGFVDIRRCEIGDAADPAFRSVEAPDRFYDQEWDVRELALEAYKPA